MSVYQCGYCRLIAAYKTRCRKCGGVMYYAGQWRNDKANQEKGHAE